MLARVYVSHVKCGSESNSLETSALHRIIKREKTIVMSEGNKEYFTKKKRG